MAGAVVGVDYAAALAIAPSECERDELLYLLMQAETGLLAGFRKPDS